MITTVALTSCFLPVRETVIERRFYTARTLNDHSIRLLSWNIHKEGGDAQWDRDFMSLARKYRPDLYTFQEALLTPEMRNILLDSSLGWDLAPNLQKKSDGSYSGVMTASRTEPLTRASVLSDYVEPVAGTRKASLVSLYKLYPSGKSLMVVNIHAINFVDLRMYRSQLSEVENEISQHNGPVIFSGDFNTWSGARLSALQRMTARLGLKEVLFSPADTEALKHFPFNLPLDHIFYRGLVVESASADVLEQVTSSDHKPLVVTFSLPNT